VKIRRVNHNIVDAAELPHVVALGPNLFAAVFRLMKLVPARFVLDRAASSGVLAKGGTVIETTSGTFGLALATLCALRGYRLILVSDPAIDASLQRRLEDLGAQVEIVRQPAPVGGLQRSRLDRMEAIRRDNPGSFWPSQYDNPHNAGAYAPVAELLAETLGHVDCLVGTVGSGGSMCGTSMYLRMVFPQLRVIGVDTFHSVLFGQPDGKRVLRGLGNSLMPRNLDHTAFDEIHWVSESEAFLATRILHRTAALFMGPTSGAAYLVASWYARRCPHQKVVTLLPDEGFRYQDTVYDDSWIRVGGYVLDRLPHSPQAVERPAQAQQSWSTFLWNRRTYEQILGKSFDLSAAA
jgi:cysteine synthase